MENIYARIYTLTFNDHRALLLRKKALWSGRKNNYTQLGVL